MPSSETFCLLSQGDIQAKLNGVGWGGVVPASKD